MRAAMQPPASPDAPDELARDRALLERWRLEVQAEERRRSSAGETLLGHYHGYFRSLCWRYRIVDDGEQAELFQELVLRLLRALPRLELESSFAGYLRRVFHTVWRETREKNPSYALVEDPEGRRSPLPAPERREIIAAIVDCSDALTERERTVFRDRIEESVSFPEIAEKLGVTLNHLYVIYHGTRRKMRECLERKGFGL